VLWVGPEGAALGRLDLRSVRRLLRERFERRLEDSTDDRGRAIRDGLARLHAGARLGRA
jgi:hypothetical protein